MKDNDITVQARRQKLSENDSQMLSENDTTSNMSESDGVQSTLDYPPSKPLERISSIQQLSIHRLVRLSTNICLVPMVVDNR